MRQVIIIGSGPAGYTAAIYAARANLEPLVVASSVEAGGELMNTTDVENFPGFPEGIQGPDLMTKMQEQAERFGAEVLYDDVVELDLDGPVKTRQARQRRGARGGLGRSSRPAPPTASSASPARSGSRAAASRGARRATASSSASATIAVVGGGDSAMEEATFLTRFASKVYVIHRRDALRASKIMQERAFANEKIEFVWNSEVADILGDEAVTGVVLRVDGRRHRHANSPSTALFVAIGNDPRTHLVHGKLDLTPEGTIWVDGRSSRTSVPGVFAAGDVIDPTYRQAVTAAGSGTVAALDAEHFLAALERGGAPDAEDDRDRRDLAGADAA